MWCVSSDGLCVTLLVQAADSLQNVIALNVSELLILMLIGDRQAMQQRCAACGLRALLLQPERARAAWPLLLGQPVDQLRQSYHFFKPAW